MQQVIKIGTRLFAVKKDMDRAERIAAQSNIRGNWQQCMQHNKQARVISNLKR